MTNPRENPLNSVHHAINSGDKAVIGFIGGSITWGTSASVPSKTSWRARVSEWFKMRFGESNIEVIHAAIGANNSLIGNCRLEEHLICHRPDLILLEFAINDLAQTQSCIEANYESIFRKTWQKLPETSFIICISGSRTDEQAALVTESVDDAFGVFSVDVGAAKRQLILSGSETGESLWADTVHPGDHGHQVYAEIVVGELETGLRKQLYLNHLRISFQKNSFTGGQKSSSMPDSFLRRIAGSLPNGITSKTVTRHSAVPLSARDDIRMMKTATRIKVSTLSGEDTPVPTPKVRLWNTRADCTGPDLSPPASIQSL